MDMAGEGNMIGIPGAQSLDDIVSQNSKDFRRRSMPVPYQGPNTSTNPQDLDESMRRASMVDMMDFGGTSPDMANFNFDPSGFNASMVDIPGPGNTGHGVRNSNNLSVNTRFQVPQSGFGMNNQSAGGFDSALSGHNAFDTDMNSPYLTSAFPNVSMGNDIGMMNSDMPTANMFSSDQFNSSMANSPIQNSFAPPMLSATPQDPGGGATLTGRNSRTPNTNASGGTPNVRQSSTRTNSNETRPDSTSFQGSSSTQPTPNVGQTANNGRYSPSKMASNPAGPPQMINGNALPWTAPPNGWPSSMAGRTHMNTQFKDAYAPSGYDLMTILVRTPVQHRSVALAEVSNVACRSKLPVGLILKSILVL